jgi:hypothetical protein
MSLVAVSTGDHPGRAGAGGRFGGVAVRARIPVGSIADVVFVAGRSTIAEEVNDAYRQEAATALPGHPLASPRIRWSPPTSSATRAPQSCTST